jgi:hypothetical protein
MAYLLFGLVLILICNSNCTVFRVVGHDLPPALACADLGRGVKPAWRCRISDVMGNRAGVKKTDKREFWKIRRE